MESSKKTEQFYTAEEVKTITANLALNAKIIIAKSPAPSSEAKLDAAFKIYKQSEHALREKLFKNPDDRKHVELAQKAAKKTMDRMVNSKKNEILKLAEKVVNPGSELLSNRLDTAYKMYQDAEKTLKEAWLNDAEYTDLNDEYVRTKQFALEQMQKILNVKDEKECLRLMQDRMARKQFDPEYIPNKSPKLHLRAADPARIIRSAERKVKTQPEVQKKAKGLHTIRRSADIMLALQSGKMMAVNARSLRLDKDEKTKMMDPLQRSAFQLIILDQKFCRGDGYIDTTEYISHNKKGYAAFVINSHGEISIFKHHNMADQMAHSSMNAQAPVFAAGEIKIVDGELKAMTDHSGHYQPKAANIYQALKYFKEHGIDISQATIYLQFPVPSLVSLPLPAEEAKNHLRYAYPATEFFAAFELAEQKQQVLVNSQRQKSLDAKKLVSQETALMDFAKQGEVTGMSYLLAKRINPNLVDGQKYTPLMYAAKHGHVEVVKLLLQYGADPLKDTGLKGEHSAWKIAEDNGHHAIVELLEDDLMQKLQPMKEGEPSDASKQASRPASPPGMRR